MKPKPFRRKKTNNLPQQKERLHTEDKCNHEYELYNVGKEQNKSYHRPTGLRPVGRFLSFADRRRRNPTFHVGCRGPPALHQISPPK